MFGKCWVCEEIAGAEAMHLVRNIKLTPERLCHWHARLKAEQDKRDEEKAKENANV